MNGKFYTPLKDNNGRHTNNSNVISPVPSLFLPQDVVPASEMKSSSIASYVEEAIASRKMAMDCARATLNTAKHLRQQVKEKNSLISELKDVIIVLKDNLDEVEHKKELLLEQIHYETDRQKENDNKNQVIIHEHIATQTTHRGLHLKNSQTC